MSEKNEVTRVNSEREKDFSFVYPQKPVTNGDKVRAITDEELASFLGDVDCCNPGHCKPGMYCVKCWFNWLKAPADEHGGDEK